MSPSGSMVCLILLPLVTSVPAPAQAPELDAPRPTAGMALGLVGVVIFGATLPITKLALVDYSPAFVTTGRALLASLAAAVVLVALRRPIPWTRIPPILLAALMLVYGSRV